MEANTPYGKEWEFEMNKLPKSELIKMVRKLQTGTTDEKLMLIETAKQAEYQVEGIINDYEGGIIDKADVMRLLGEYTGRIMEIFWNNAKSRNEQLQSQLSEKDKEHKEHVEKLCRNIRILEERVKDGDKELSELKAKHKEDVMNAFNDGKRADIYTRQDFENGKEYTYTTPEQYYTQTHGQ